MTGVCFLDTETTGLDPDKHQIWEVALITPDDKEFVWQFPIVEIEADPFALDIGRWWDRRWEDDNEISRVNALYDADKTMSRRKVDPSKGRAIKPDPSWCKFFQRLTAKHHLAGAVISFDEERLRRLLRSNGVLPRWHYHLIDVEALAVGYLAAQGDVTNLPWNSDALTEQLNLEIPNDEERHTALGDARWAKAIYEKVLGK